ncbi:MAG: hypothetical protein IJE60_01985 [Tyzzerella sp.]|nr:hypothetical protein [Tyzzerella sp.]
MKNDYLNTLEKDDMSIREDYDLDFEEQNMLFPIETWFDVDKKFGVNTNSDEGSWVNLYATYNPCTGEIKIPYTVDADDGTFGREYIPTDEERDLFRRLMEQSCEKRNKMTCRESYITAYVEHNMGEISLECVEHNEMIVVRNTNDNFILYAEAKGGRLENHVGHAIELATYGGKECIAIECMDCNEILYDTASEELQYVEVQTEAEAPKVDPDRWKNLLAKAVCYIGESEAGADLYDTLHNEIGMTDEEIEKLKFTSLAEYFEEVEEQSGMTMQ